MSNYPSGYNEQPSLDDLLQPYEMRIRQLESCAECINKQEERIKSLEDFIKKARSESELININGVFNVVLPYWFMKDEIV